MHNTLLELDDFTSNIAVNKTFKLMKQSLTLASSGELSILSSSMLMEPMSLILLTMPESKIQIC